MHRRSSRLDDVQNALRVVEEAIGEKLKPKKKNPAAVALGKLGGRKGGRARAEKLTAQQRSEIASTAARSRWSKPQTAAK